jgi:hypothetical protein
VEGPRLGETVEPHCAMHSSEIVIAVDCKAVAEALWSLQLTGPSSTKLPGMLCEERALGKGRNRHLRG